MEREKNHKEALQKEGSVYNTAENAYKSLWYRGASSGDREDRSNNGRHVCMGLFRQQAGERAEC